MRIISLLPSATEILCELGLEDNIFGVTNECKYPSSINLKEKVLSTEVNFDELNSIEIDKIINESINTNKPIFSLDINKIEEIRPDFIVTQDLCEVCAVSSKEINQLLGKLTCKPQIIETSPTSIKGINDSIINISQILGVNKRGEGIVEQINSDIKTITSITKDNIDKPRVFCMDWLDPIYSAGHWVPEMVTIAGGLNMNQGNNVNSQKIAFKQLLEFAPHFIFIMPCGYNIERTLNEINILLENPQLNKIPAFNNGQVYIVDAYSYFSKPSHRILEGIKIITRTINAKNYKYNPEPDAILNLQNYMHFEFFAG